VNVLLVPAHPGFPGQIPQSRKTVVVVVVVVSLALPGPSTVTVCDAPITDIKSENYSQCKWYRSTVQKQRRPVINGIEDIRFKKITAQLHQSWSPGH